jgi:hypothetical protein
MDSAEIHDLAIKLAEAVFTEIETSRSILKDAITECLRRELLASGVGEYRRAEPPAPALQPDKKNQKKINRVARTLDTRIIDDPTAPRPIDQQDPREALSLWARLRHVREMQSAAFATIR